MGYQIIKWHSRYAVNGVFKFQQIVMKNMTREIDQNRKYFYWQFLNVHIMLLCMYS